MTENEIEELFMTRDAVELLAQLFRLIMRIEAVTDKRLNEAIDDPMNKLFRALRTRECELCDLLEKTICKE